ncbi:hypothetical protein SAMN05421736_109159 [Evansella caseinilytica]|uniref:DUF2000 domain-containing protein n=1 Tax=Evansella caseinilytica TaxID=1503961 RepID=A0A1H3S0K3_9BACI|nr:DUF2000 domain-containing protein [Evansella caseinilytica]SDZ31444.1 hypothetical protein SAMN05421736_109159 [Evansella caseinilytica]
MEKKCVMIVDAELPAGMIANTAAVLALTLGKEVEGIVGPDVKDESGCTHLGITTMPIPILKGSDDEMKKIRNKIVNGEFSELLVVDFSHAAQTTKTYQEYTEKIASTSAADLVYLGLALYGEKKKINRLTGSMALLR